MAKAGKAPLARVPDVLDALEEEVGLVLEDSTVVQRFAAGLKAFFQTASALEAKAKNNLAEARTLKAPTTQEEDERIQKTIKSYGADKKDVLDHWTITQQVSRFHKRLTSARSRAEDPNEQAVKIATQLHNTYVDNERRRVAAENERLRREAEERARADRARELEEMERQAAERELASAQLSAREQVFVRYVAAGQKADNAARVAGYKVPGMGERLMGLVKIVEAIKAAREAAAIREQAAAVKDEPLNVQFAPATKAVSTAVGFDRETHGAELLDERLLIEAIVGGRHGIPLDILTVKPAKLNEYARSMHELINKWPGVKYKKTTSLV